MSFPIFFKMEIKKGWRKSCDFVISNPVSGVNWRDLIVQALHNQRSAQIHINLSVHTPQPCLHTAVMEPLGVQSHVHRGHTALHILCLSPMAQTSQGGDSQMSVSTSPSEASGDLRWRQFWLLTSGWCEVCSWKTSNNKTQCLADLRSSYDLKTSSTHLPSRTKAELHPHSTHWVWSPNWI